jgi:ABC-type transport system involved in multi-copper enzyme maturation permease subunit
LPRTKDKEHGTKDKSVLGPIFAREFLTVPRRASHYAGRAIGLGALWTLGVTAWLATGGLGNEEPTLGETARFGLLLFQLFTVVTLVLVAFFAALSAAGTVAREKDRRTFVLLLLTDMTDGEIVLGKLLGSLLPIGLMLIGILPILSLLLLLGGMTPGQVIKAWLVLLATAIAAGSLGGLIALWRDKTFQALALSVLALVLYVCGVETLGLFAYFADPSPGASAVGRWLAAVNWSELQSWLDPIRALLSTLAPESAGLPPAYGYVAAMAVWSVVLNGWGVYKLRDWNPGGEPIMQRETPEEEEAKDRARAHAAPGQVRQVWGNPVLWREIRTRAYGRRPLVVKLAYVVVAGLIAYAAVTPVLGGQRVAFAAGYGMVPVTVLSLLLLAAQATTAITSERDGRSLDLLLATDLTPKEFIFGKIGGILYNTKEYLLPPLILAGIFAGLGALATPPASTPERGPQMNAINFAAVSAGLLVVFAFVLTLGIHVALRTVNSRQAVTHALGTVFFLSVGTMVCIDLILINPGAFEYQFLSFSLFLVVGIGGLWWVLSADRPTPALTLASIGLPICMFYCVTNVLVAQPGTQASAPPLVPFAVIAASFGFAVVAMTVPMLSEFDVAFGRTHAQE